MKTAPFTYHRPATIDAALDLLAQYGDEAKILAGGQSLLPLMALRMARPAHLVDLAAVPDLDRITVGDDGSVTIGAMVRHEDAGSSPDIARYAPLITATMPHVAHRAIRTRGTVVGSIAHGDPAAEMPAVALATGATMIVRSVDGEREIPAAEFFLGFLDTALEPGDILTGVRFPPWPPGTAGATVEVARRHGDYALVGVVIALTVADALGAAPVIDRAALAYFGTSAVPQRALRAERALAGQRPGQEIVDVAARTAADELDLPGDNHGSAAYRSHLAAVLTRRGLAQAAATIDATGGSR